MAGPYRDRADEFYSGKARIQGYQDARAGLPKGYVKNTNPHLYELGFHEGGGSRPLLSNPPNLPSSLKGWPSKFS